MVREATREKDRRSGNPKSSVRGTAKKSGGGGKYTEGKIGDTYGGATVDYDDPNYDPDERRVDPDDGTAYKYEELNAFYKGKFTAQEVAEYWEYTCTAVKRKGKAKSAGPAGPTLAESAAEAKSKWKPKAKAKATAKRLTDEDLSSEGPLAKEVAAVIPYYPFQKMEKFYDIQGLLHHPSLLNAVCAVFAKRYRSMGITKIAALEARGFLFAPLAIKLGKPFVFLRKQGKMPNTVSSAAYTKDYSGAEVVCMQRGAIVEGDKVVVIDDLLTGGGTMAACVEMIKACKAEVVECGCLVEMKGLNGREQCLKAGAKDVWGFIEESLLTNKAELPDDYVDDGAA